MGLTVKMFKLVFPFSDGPTKSSILVVEPRNMHFKQLLQLILLHQNLILMKSSFKIYLLNGNSFIRTLNSYLNLLHKLSIAIGYFYF